MSQKDNYKICPQCELNFIKNTEELCAVCAPPKKIKGNSETEDELMKNNLVHDRFIKNPMTATQVYEYVRWLREGITSYYEDDKINIKTLYGKGKYSYRGIIDRLKHTVKYSEIRIGESRHLEKYHFDGDEVMEKFIMSDPELAKIIEHIEEVRRKRGY